MKRPIMSRRKVVVDREWYDNGESILAELAAIGGSGLTSAGIKSMARLVKRRKVLASRGLSTAEDYDVVLGELGL